MAQTFKYFIFICMGIGIASLFFIFSIPKSDMNKNQRNPQRPPSSSGQNMPGSTDSTDTTDSADPTDSRRDNCQITSCHGLDIMCGNEYPQMCTMEYRLGDFCREFASCKTVQGNCQLVESEIFESCKSCVESCTQSDPIDSFACEDICRKTFASN